MKEVNERSRQLSAMRTYQSLSPEDPYAWSGAGYRSARSRSIREPPESPLLIGAAACNIGVAQLMAYYYCLPTSIMVFRLCLVNSPFRSGSMNYAKYTVMVHPIAPL
jgi:hypothetical protein